MIILSNKENCCGCTSCYSKCPVNAITMKKDEEGFEYPIFNNDKCIKCGECKRVCPVINRDIIPKTQINKSYILRSKDNNTLIHSTSGGFFTSVAEYCLSQNFIIYAVGFDDNYNVIHKCVSDIHEISQCRGSKYVQSNLNDTFNEIKQKLKVETKVLFIGTPCQVNGLKLFLKEDYTNLYTVDVVCHGTPSPYLWSQYKEFLMNKYKSDIKGVYFRNKTYGYHSSTMKIIFSNSKIYLQSARTDYFLKSFFSEISSRPSCYNCPVKINNRMSDFTIFDCWNIEKAIGIKDDDKGYTNVFIQSAKGADLFNLVNDKYIYYESNPQVAINLDGDMINKSAKPHKERTKFYVSLHEEGIEQTIKNYIPITIKDYLIERSKRIIYKFNLMKFLKVLRNKGKYNE